MGEGSHVRVSYERAPNFFERLGSSFVGVFLGLAAVVAGCTLLFWNEVAAGQIMTTALRCIIYHSLPRVGRYTRTRCLWRHGVCVPS